MKTIRQVQLCFALMLLAALAPNAAAQDDTPEDVHHSLHILDPQTMVFSVVTRKELKTISIDIAAGVVQRYREVDGEPKSVQTSFFKPIQSDLLPASQRGMLIELGPYESRSCGGALSLLSHLMDSLEAAMDNGDDPTSDAIGGLVQALVRALHDFISCLQH